MNMLGKITAKVLTAAAAAAQVQQCREQGMSVVFSNGCFDILHRGHVEYLAQAAALGNVLVVGINSDASVRRLKGNSRPLQDQTARSMVIAALECVGYAVIFDEDTPYNLIQMLKPDVLVKGADYKPEHIVGSDIVLAAGGRVATIPLVSGYSTTNIAKRIQEQQQI
jgi:rfaE bifunctional protein nucleotidyltransferase chain/domain